MIGTAHPLIERMRGYDPHLDGERLERAFNLGMSAHERQVRASGEPYFTHPVAVANLLIDMRLDADTVITDMTCSLFSFLSATSFFASSASFKSSPVRAKVPAMGWISAFLSWTTSCASGELPKILNFP